MPGTVEEQAEVILKHIITDIEKEVARIDVESADAEAWNSARLAARLVSDDEIVSELSKSAVYRAVAQLYKRRDTTIKRRVKAALVIPEGVVREHPQLTFSYFRTAADAKHRCTPLESALDIIWMIEREAERFGKLPPVSTVEAWVYRDSNEKVKTVWMSRADGISDQLEKIIHDRYAPEDFRSFAGWIRVMLLSYLETGKSPLMDDQSPTTKDQSESKEKGGDPEN